VWQRTGAQETTRRGHAGNQESASGRARVEREAEMRAT
jgi:hypothetical protein